MATVSFILDTRRANKEGKYPIKMRITHEGKRKYYRICYQFDTATKDEWLSINSLNSNSCFRELRQKMKSLKVKTLQTIQLLPVFTFEMYDGLVNPKKHLSNQKDKPKRIQANIQTLKGLFTDYIDALMSRPPINWTVF